MRKYILFVILLFISITNIKAADDISFVIDVPASAAKGERVHLKYILNGGNGTDISIPDDIPGFEVVYGPGIARIDGASIVNGKTVSQTNSTVYTYTLIAKSEGRFTLPAATIKVNGRTYKSKTARIEVFPPDQNAGSQPGSQPQLTRSTSTADGVSSDDAFVKVIFSKTKVYEQEAVLVTFRFYTVLNYRDVGEIEFPEFEGFIVEDVNTSSIRQRQAERVKGRNYFYIDVRKLLLFPQRLGKITIPSGKMDFTFEVSTGHKMKTPLGTIDVMTEARRVLYTPKETIEVAALPVEGKPVDFNGAVGSFTMKPEISSQKMKANEAATITLNISGTGNIKLMKNPEVKFPEEIETYDPKVTNDVQISGNGLTGIRSIEYPFIPRSPGKYEIPPIEFSYYDLQSKSYKVLKSPAYTLEVDKDPNAGKNTSVSYMNQRDLEAEQDIRYLKTDDYKFSNPSDLYVGSVKYILWYIIPLLAFIIFSIVYRKQIKANANIALMKTKKANKVASKRLKQAKKHLLVHDKDKFYEEVLRAVWGYLSDKLLIPTADLSRENVEMELMKYGVDEVLIKQYISIIDTCEFARYAPSESNEAMDKLYDETVDAIGKMEDIIRIKK